MLDRRYISWFSTAIRVECGQEIQREMYLYRSDGLRLFGVSVFRHDHFSRAINCCLLRPYIPSGRKTGQILQIYGTIYMLYMWIRCKHNNELLKISLIIIH